jgi:hypothetical protein
MKEKISLFEETATVENYILSCLVLLLHKSSDLLQGLGSTWTSPDGTSRIRCSAERVNALSVSVAGLLEMEIVSDVEKELIADPPVHFLNFEIKAIANTANVHGVSWHSTRILFLFLSKQT